MVVVESGEESFYLDANIKKNLDVVQNSVLHYDFDYIGVVSGICGVGKSTLAQQICKYLDPTFNTKERVCFTGLGENGLIQRTSSALKGQAFMLDESFESLNTKVGMSAEFVRIVNHLQLIRQRGLFIILCLPNFFDLSKGIAIFRSSHLFVVYTKDSYKRGYFAAYGRNEKKLLYVLGQKFMNYHATKPNFRGRFVKKWVVDRKLYDKLKSEHLIEQGKKKVEKVYKDTMVRNNFVRYLKLVEKWNAEKIAEVGKIGRQTVFDIMKKT